MTVRLSAAPPSLTTTIAGHAGLNGGGGALLQSINTTTSVPINPTTTASTSVNATAASVFPSSYVNASLPLNDSAHLNDTMMTWSVVLGVSFLVMGLMPKEVGPAYPNSGFLPATDGGTPACVQDPRDTFCLDPKKYPKERILYLLENKMFDVDSMLMDESRDSYIFESRNSPPVSMYDYDPLRQTYEPPRQTYEQPHQTYKPPRPSYGPPPSPPSLPSNGYLPPRQNNFSTTSKPYHHPSSPLSPPAKYAPPHHTPSGHTYGAAPYHYGTPAPSFDNEGPYPRYRKATTPSSSYLTRYLPPPPPSRSPPKPQPWWRKVMRSSRRRHKRQLSSMELCAYEEDYIMPRAALNNKGTWMFLVNMEEESPQYTQAVQTKKCIPGATSCSGACNIPNGFTATCQQQYVQKRLIALDGSGSTLATDLFWFPSCCLCKIVPDG